MWPAFTETWCQPHPTPFWGWIWKLPLMLDLTEQIPAVGFKNVVARLNPEPEVIVIIFTIIMWVKCPGVHTLLDIYGSSVSLSVPFSPSARLSLSVSLSLPPPRAACLTSFLSSQRTRIPASLHRKEWSLSSQLPNLCRCLAKQGQKRIIPKRRC